MVLCSTSCNNRDLLLFSLALSPCRDLINMVGAHFWILKQQALLLVVSPKKHLEYACMCTFSSFVLHDLTWSYHGISCPTTASLTTASVTDLKHVLHGPAISITMLFGC